MEAAERVAEPSMPSGNPSMVVAPNPKGPMTMIIPQDGSGTCGCGCGGGGASGAETPSYIYALGRIEARFPSLSVEKEYVQATSRSDISGKMDQQALHTILSDSSYRYLARQVCWVLTVEGVETYILRPRDPQDLGVLIEAIKPPNDPTDDVNDIDVVIGLRGPIASPDLCNGLMLPVVFVDQTYSFTLKEFLQLLKQHRHQKKSQNKNPEADLPGIRESIPEISDKEFEHASHQMFRRIHQLTDNAGSTDEHRALNYVAVRSAPIYQLAALRYHLNYSLSLVETRPSRLSGARKVLDVIFSYTQRGTEVTEKHFVRVDVTEEFPFLVTKLSPFYDR